MRKLLVVPFILLLAVIFCVTYFADQLFGFVAYTYGYVVYCALAALVVGVVWRACFERLSRLIVLVVFCLLAANLFLPPPSERLLRSAMLKAPPGTPANAIEAIVKQEYEGSGYVLPAIKKDRARDYDRVHVSLYSQQAKSCTALIFLIQDEHVVRCIFSGD